MAFDVHIIGGGLAGSEAAWQLAEAGFRVRVSDMRCGDQHRVPAGSALAVDRKGFAAEVTRAVETHPNIQVVRERVDSLPDHPAIVATGPLTGSSLAAAIASETGSDA